MAEIERLDGFIKQSQKGQQRFKSFIGYYKLPRSEIHCGKSDCNTRHGFGYVVSLESGSVTAIGHVCGEKEFGDVFTAAAQSADVEMQREIAESAVSEALATLLGYRAAADALMHARRGALWYERAERSFQALLPRRLAGEIYELASRGDGRIVRTRMRTRDDYPPPGARGSSDVVEEAYGQIVGVGALMGPSPKRILTDQILAEMPVFVNTTPGYLVGNKLQHRRFNEWSIGIPHALKTAEDRLKRAIAFFETTNLRLLAHVARNSQDRARLAMLSWNDAVGLVEREAPGRTQSDAESG